jgi:hypothetical protein
LLRVVIPERRVHRTRTESFLEELVNDSLWQAEQNQERRESQTGLRVQDVISRKLIHWVVRAAWRRCKPRTTSVERALHQISGINREVESSTLSAGKHRD